MKDIPNGRYLLQIQRKFPLLKDKIDEIIESILLNHGSKECWSDALGVLKNIGKEIKNKKDKDMFNELVNGILVIYY